MTSGLEFRDISSAELTLPELKARLKQGDREIARQKMLNVAMLIGGLLLVLPVTLLVTSPVIEFAIFVSPFWWILAAPEIAVSLIGLSCAVIADAQRLFKETARKEKEWKKEREKLSRQPERLTKRSVIELTEIHQSKPQRKRIPPPRALIRSQSA